MLLVVAFFWLQNKRIENVVTNNPIGEDYRSRVKSLQEIIADKLQQPLETVYINISQEDNEYAKGVYTIADKYVGIFIAKKKQGSWSILYLNNKNYSCQDVNDLKIPENLVTDCLK